MIGGRPYAGFWRRAGASLLDLLVMVLAIVILVWVAFVAFPGLTLTQAQALISVPLGLAYYVIGNGSGGTFGKRWVGLRIVDAAGEAPGLGRAFVRYLIPLTLTFSSWVEPGSTLSLLAILLSTFGLVDILWMIWDPRKQTLHDKLAGTFVIQP